MSVKHFSRTNTSTTNSKTKTTTKMLDDKFCNIFFLYFINELFTLSF